MNARSMGTAGRDSDRGSSELNQTQTFDWWKYYNMEISGPLFGHFKFNLVELISLGNQIDGGI